MKIDDLEVLTMQEAQIKRAKEGAKIIRNDRYLLLAMFICGLLVLSAIGWILLYKAAGPIEFNEEAIIIECILILFFTIHSALYVLNEIALRVCESNRDLTLDELDRYLEFIKQANLATPVVAYIQKMNHIGRHIPFKGELQAMVEAQKIEDDKSLLSADKTNQVSMDNVAMEIKIETTRLAAWYPA